MKYKNILIFLFFLLIFSLFVNAFKTNSTNYQTELTISGGGDNLSSTNYKTEIVSSTITQNISSTSYKQFVGFLYLSLVEEEEPSPAPPSGGGGVGIISNFIVDKDLIKVLIKQGGSQREIIRINNIGNIALNITIESSLDKFMVISEESFSLSAGESKEIFIDIFAKEEEIPDAYTGKITIKGGNIEKIINVIIEVKERRPLFDVSLEVLSKELKQGGNVKADFHISNLGDLKNIDISLYYSIEDFEGNIITFKEESISIDEQLDITRKLRLPKEIPLGNYAFHLKVSYDNITASGTDVFEVNKERIKLQGIFLLWILFITLIISIIVTSFAIINLIRKNYLIKNRAALVEILTR